LPEASTPAEPNEQEMLLGYALSGPPTVWRLLGAWRFDWILGTAAVAAAAAYLVGVWVVRRRGDRWKAGRTIAWLSGCAVMLLATSSGFGRYAETQFSVHMSAHMMLAMVAPALLVLGGPVTLALRALPAAGRGGPPGARETLLAAVHSRPARIITHPLFVLPVFIGSFAAIYFTDLFSVLVSSHLGHLLMNVHFLLVGYLYYWLVIGIDPGPRRFSPPARLGFLMVPVPFHAFFGLVLMNTRMPLAGDYYTRLALPWVPDLVDDQRLGGAIAWASTEAPIAVVILALVVQWARSDEREARRSDRRGDRTDDELDAYNAMLADLSQRRPESSQLRQTSHADGASDEGAGHHRPGQVVADGPTAKQRAHTTHPEPSTGSGQ
jgi:putative copper resistance protein D